VMSIILNSPFVKNFGLHNSTHLLLICIANFVPRRQLFKIVKIFRAYHFTTPYMAQKKCRL
jgi:hypothetical protein